MACHRPLIFEVSYVQIERLCKKQRLNLNNNRKVTQELDDIKDYLIDNKLKNVNFDTLDLTDVVSSDPSKNKKPIHQQSKDLTVNELVIELLKPELKKWLNENLPTIVKNAVDQEIKKITEC
ncbi:DUF2497 domain-containing protein [Candidatus Bandiella woodruffii]|uniref:DUF2497 domain-containing protein n=1 Tax=Candidatus Bandiella euplotis TaxID=1664265 RepID=A0ABZ0UQ37_9RICK|nr:DUF2497 domain-containing protein [Candidatus Bandiella woodruffii]